MTDHFPPLIKAEELSNIYKKKDLVIADVSAGADARANYNRKHLAGAIFIDLNTQLAEIHHDAAKGGRHPLPSIKQFSETLGKLGISPESHVIIYDDKNGSNAAARFWWMLRSIGHERVQVLDGGLQAAEKIGLPISSKQENPSPTAPYKMEGWKLPLADMAEVERVSQDPSHLVIDVRDSQRYRGEKEPIDLVAGHIPGAVNLPFTTNLDENGYFLAGSELKNKYQQLFEKRDSNNIIVHCGSGVTACHTLLAIAHAGLDIPRLYVGSWSEWSRNNKPIIREKQKEKE